MKFRTQVEIDPHAVPIAREARIVTLGSCFSDEIGNRLQRDGFNVAVNPFGNLFNPRSIADMAAKKRFETADVYTDTQGQSHLLAMDTRWQGDADKLLKGANMLMDKTVPELETADIWLVTWGTAWVFEHMPTGRIAGNCHKLPASQFNRRMLDVDAIVDMWRPLLEGRRVIFTVSPVRHLNDGLHGNTLSKSRLHLAIEKLGAEYFPAYEALVDDLRDYRFYADDLKHPSGMGADYVYELFMQTYMSPTTQGAAMQSRRQWLQSQHRPHARR